MTTRRAFMRGSFALLAAPAIVRAGSLMPVRRPPFVSWVGAPIETILGDISSLFSIVRMPTSIANGRIIAAESDVALRERLLATVTQGAR